MLYATLRATGRVALRWFYRRVDVVGVEHVPLDAPLLVAANHPNQLVDVLLVACALPRPVTVTGKAVLLDNPLLRPILRRLPFVPLRRASDERQRAAASSTAAATADAGAATPAPAPDPGRNAGAFDAITDALAANAAVLVFPEGISHAAPELAPVKTGIARMALQARDTRALRRVHILPVGLTFERKEQPRTRVLVEIGPPLDLDAWTTAGPPVETLTREVDARLRAVTLNFPSDEASARARRVGNTLAGIFDAPRPLGESDRSLADHVELVRRSEAARRRLTEQAGDAAGAARATAFERRLHAFADELADRRIELADLPISLGTRKGARFVVREALIAALAGPLALWGRLNHWLPLRLARTLAVRSSLTPQDPAMHTIVAGLVAVPLFYAAQTAAVWLLAGPWWALLYLASLIPSAGWDLRYQDRRRRAVSRVHAYRLLRADRPLRDRLCGEAAWLRDEAVALERQLASPARNA